MKRWYPVLILGVVVVGGLIFWQLTRSLSPLSAEKLPDVVDYNFHIRPILSDRCFKCHGPDANQRKFSWLRWQIRQECRSPMRM